VGLTKDGSPEQLMSKLQELKTKADQADEHAATIVTLNDTIGTLQQAAMDAEVDAVVDGAVSSRKITDAQKPFYKQMGKTNLENLKQLFDTMPTVPTLQNLVGAGTDASDPLLKLSYKEAHKAGKLAVIKQMHPAHYNHIFKEQYGKEPQA
jgi:phage I-like protein